MSTPMIFLNTLTGYELCIGSFHIQNQLEREIHRPNNEVNERERKKRREKTFLLREWKNVCNFRKSLLNTQLKLQLNDMKRSTAGFFDRCCWLNFYRTAIDSLLLWRP